jgi:hypothetical protein
MGIHYHLLLELRIEIFCCNRANLFFIYVVAGGGLLYPSGLEKGFGVILRVMQI